METQENQDWVKGVETQEIQAWAEPAEMQVIQGWVEPTETQKSQCWMKCGDEAWLGYRREYMATGSSSGKSWVAGSRVTFFPGRSLAGTGFYFSLVMGSGSAVVLAL